MTLLDDVERSAEPAEAPPLRPRYTPPPVTPRSQLGEPAEGRPWWTPLGWLLVLVATVLFYGVLLALSPLLVAAIAGRRLWRRTLRWRRSPADLRIAVVGGGWSGLQALQRFRELGVGQVDVFERHDEIGGTWSRHLRYHGLQIHGSMTVTSFDGLPYSEDPDVQGGKVMAEEVERYIHRFAGTRDLLRDVQCNSAVEALDCRSEDRTGTLTVTDTRTGEVRTTGPYDLVVWASMAAKGRAPALPGSDAFRGRQLHTTAFSDAEVEDIVRNDRRVVLVGGSKAACDVALGLRRMGHTNVEWVMRRPYLFYKFEALLHDASAANMLRGLTYLPTVLFTGLSRRLGAVLHWSSGHLHALGRRHTDFTAFHGGVLCATQRRELRHVPFRLGNPVALDEDGLVLEDGARLGADVVVWATGNGSGIDELVLTKDGRPFELDPDAKLFNHFVVPELPVLASSTALWTTFGPMRATNAADLAVYHLAVRPERSEARMRRSARRQLSRNSLVHSFIWAHDACWLQRWVHFHIDLVRQGITPVEAFFKHAVEVFVLSKETPLRFNLLPREAIAPSLAVVPPAPPAAQPAAGAVALGPLGRLGRFTATRFRLVLVAWLVVGGGLGALAPQAEKALSGTGWEVTGSDSVEARAIIAQQFQGMTSYGLTAVVHSADLARGDARFDAVVADVQRVLDADPAASVVVPPTARSTAPDGRTALVQAGAALSSDDMVKAADELKVRLAALSRDGVEVDLTGQSAKWSDFNQANKEAMLKSELISWPVTMAILLIAFGSLVAAGLPLMLTMLGLSAAAGMLFLGTQLMPISLWAMNFAMMFCLALGIDYALFLVHRFRAAFFGEGLGAEDATAVTMDTAGKAVVFSGVTVLVSLSAVMLVPSPAFRSMALGVMLAVVFVLAATLTLLPAVLARLGPRVNKLSLPWAREQQERSPRLRRWAEQLWSMPLRHGAVAVALLVALALPVLDLKTAMPTIAVIPQEDSSYVGDRQVVAAFGTGANGPLQVVAPAALEDEVQQVLRRDPGIAMTASVERSGPYALFTAVPADDPDTPAVGATIDRLRDVLPRDAVLGGALVGGAVTENHDLAAELEAKTPLVIGVVVALGFLLLLVALQAPVLAALGVLTNLLATAAAFGIAKRIFQDGQLSGLLGFEPQGFLDAWGPVFFFAMVFAISMDYTLFLLSSAKEAWDRTGDPRAAMVAGVERSGRVVFAAGAVMVAVFFTFALSGPIPPKEMGVVLGVAVLLDVLLIRLLLLPVLLRATGRAAWWLPAPLRRVLPKITFGHGGPR
jgi:putative drug exporter of the RND superfamily